MSGISTINGADFVPGVLYGDNYQLNYRTTLTKPQQKKPGNHSWSLWNRRLKTLITTSKASTNKFRQQLGMDGQT